MERLTIFNAHRPLMMAIAYRMLSSQTEAEDILQEAWIRWQSAEVGVRSPKSFLSAIVTRLCIDQLRSARVRRERYIGTWLPEPLLTEKAQDFAELSESLSYAFLTLLDCLSPIERAVFLLREVFDYDYSKIAEIVGKTTANCRQITCRSRRRLALRQQQPPLSTEGKEKVISQFLTSWNQRDISSLVSLMSDDIIFLSDGGGRVTAARYPLRGHQKVARFLTAIRSSQIIPDIFPQRSEINGQPGILNIANGSVQSIFSFELSEEGIQSIFAVANPDKLRSFPIPTQQSRSASRR